MPVIPPAATFTSEGLNQRPTFFDCNDASRTTIIYLPSYNYTFPSNESTAKLEYTKSGTIDMIANGVEIITKDGDQGWPLCLACGPKTTIVMDFWNYARRDQDGNDIYAEGSFLSLSIRPFSSLHCRT